jgi:CRP-like cAMP-binding protein
VEDDQLTTLIDAMFECPHEAGAAVITQGAVGDNFYVVHDGECEVFVRKGGEEKRVLTCGKGDTFGELALMYNAPRAATVRAKSACVLYAVDRMAFKFILMDTTLSRRARPGRRRAWRAPSQQRPPALPALADARCTTASSPRCRSSRRSPSTSA